MDECCRTVLNVLNQFEYLDVLVRLAHRQPHDHEATITPDTGASARGSQRHVDAIPEHVFSAVMARDWHAEII